MSNPYKDSRPFRAITVRHAFRVAAYNCLVNFFSQADVTRNSNQEILQFVDLLTRIVDIETKSATEGESYDGTEEDRLAQIE